LTCKDVIDTVKDYLVQWDKYEKEELDPLSEWIKSTGGMLKY
jgi:hypothetical protein